jgi:hypothetical protein
MKMAVPAAAAGSFSEQIGVVAGWFSSWNDCEKVVALYCLLRKLPVVQTKFLAQALDQILSTNSVATAVSDQEQQANDPVFVNTIGCSSDGDRQLTAAVHALLQCLPLLRTGNAPAKAAYLRVIPSVLSRAADTRRHLADCQQILSYALIHPAISADELTTLSAWQSRLLEESSRSPPSQSASNGSLAVGGGGQQGLGGNAGANIFTNGSTGGYGGGGHPGLTKVWSLPFETGSVSGGGMASSGGGGRLGGRAVGGGVGSGLVGVPFEPPSLVSASPSTSTSPTAHGLPPVRQGMATSSSHSGHPKLSRASTVAAGPPSGIPEWIRQSVEFGGRRSDNSSPSPSSSSGKSATSTLVSSSRLSVLGSSGGGLDSLSHVPLSPQSSDASSGSGGAGAEADESANAGMQEVSTWLKSLRLHKYSGLFQQMTYDDMMNLREDWLEAQGVTKGARNKILLSIKKLNERPGVLRRLEKEIMTSGNIWSAISELRQILNTPIKAFDPAGSTTVETSHGMTPALSGAVDRDQSGAGMMDTDSRTSSGSESEQQLTEQDLPGLITRVLGKLCTQLLVTMRPENDCLTNYLHLLDKCTSHQAFTDEQKKKMLSWRQQIQRVWQFQVQRHHRAAASSASLPPQSQSRGSLQQRALRGQSPSAAATGAAQQPQQQPSWTFIGGSGLPGSRGGVLAGASSGGTSGVHPVVSWQTSAPHYPGTASLAAFCPPRPQLDQSVAVTTVKQPLSRTQSAPLRSAQPGLSIHNNPPVLESDLSATNEELHASLNSLCLSMMEAAMGNMADTL